MFINLHWSNGFLYISLLKFYVLMVKSECQQLICEILRATPEAASADAVAQTAKVAKKASKKDKRQVTFNVGSSYIYWDGFLIII